MAILEEEGETEKPLAEKVIQQAKKIQEKSKMYLLLIRASENQGQDLEAVIFPLRNPMRKAIPFLKENFQTGESLNFLDKEAYYNSI